MQSSSRAIGRWRPAGQPRSVKRARSSRDNDGTRTGPSSESRRASPPPLHLPEGAWALRGRPKPAHATVLVVDGTNFAALTYRGRRRRNGVGAAAATAATPRDEFARWLAFLSAAVRGPAATVVAFDNKEGGGGGGGGGGVAASPVVVASAAAARRGGGGSGSGGGGWDGAAAAAFVGGGARSSPPLPGGSGLLQGRADVIQLVAPAGQTADDAIADLCRALRSPPPPPQALPPLTRPPPPPSLSVVIASSDRDMRRLVASDPGRDAATVSFLELVAGARGDASPLRLHQAAAAAAAAGGGGGGGSSGYGKGGPGREQEDAETAALALTGSRKHGVAGLNLPGVTSRGSAAAMVLAAGGFEALCLAAGAAGDGGVGGAATRAIPPGALRALADPELARRARRNYAAVSMGASGGGGGARGAAVAAAAEDVWRLARSFEADADTDTDTDADADADTDAEADAAAKALFPPFLRRRAS